ncbi:MAG: hypothetical protein RSE62_03435 [Citrobacter sp.]
MKTIKSAYVCSTKGEACTVTYGGVTTVHDNRVLAEAERDRLNGVTKEETKPSLPIKAADYGFQQVYK